MTGQQRLLARLRLACFTITVILVIHALPGKLSPEIFPLTRFAMYAEGSSLPPDPLLVNRILVLDANCTAHHVSLRDTYGATGVKALGDIRERLLRDLIGGTPAQQALARQDINRAAELSLAFTPVDVRVVTDVYPLESRAGLPYASYAERLERTLVWETGDVCPAEETL